MATYRGKGSSRRFLPNYAPGRNVSDEEWNRIFHPETEEKKEEVADQVETSSINGK